MPDDLTEAIDRLVELGQQTGDPVVVPGGNVPYTVIPTDCKVEDLSRFLYNDHSTRPERVKANVKVLDADSFVEYYKAFADDSSRVFAFEPQCQVLAVLDYHENSKGARWGQHRLTLDLRKSEEWNTWLKANNQQMSQMGFSEYLEQNGLDIVDPAPATVMEVARDMEATTEVEFGGGSRTANGQIRFKYSETTKGSMANGTLEVPEQFKIFIPVFVGGPRIYMTALLRFRLKEGRLVLFYTLVRPEAVMREAFLEARNAIAGALDITIINGTPA